MRVTRGSTGTIISFTALPRVLTSLPKTAEVLKVGFVPALIIVRVLNVGAAIQCSSELFCINYFERLE